MPPESAEELLNALLGEDRSLQPLKRCLIERTEGNPFFLEESVRTLVETEVLVGERGAYRMAKAPEAWQIPATAQAILAARIDRLATEDKRLLQAASVIGKDVPFALLHAIADMPEDQLAAGAQPPPGGRVPVRDEPLPGSRVHVQARADPRGRIRQSPSGTAPRDSMRGSLTQSRRSTTTAGRARRTTRPSCHPWAGSGEGGTLFP